MKVEEVPILGKIHKSINRIMFNFVLLAVINFILAILILVYPKALDLLVSLLLIVSSFVLINITYNIGQHKKKYMKFFNKN